MARRMVGRRVVEDQPMRVALLITVYRRWWWQRDEFYSEEDLSVVINEGILKIESKDEILSYNVHAWRKVRSREMQVRAKV